MSQVRKEVVPAEILAELVKGEASAKRFPRQAGDWELLLEEMASEGVANLLYYLLKREGLLALVPPEVSSQLGQWYLANLRKNLIFAARLRSVFAVLSEQAIPFMVLKGLALAELVYPALGIRGTSDVDILVHKEDMIRLDAVLVEKGYHSRDAAVAQALSNPVGYLASLDYHRQDGSPPNLHIHWHLVNTSVPAYMFAAQIDLDRLWEMARPVMVCGAAVRVPCPEHLLLYLSEHGLRVNHSFDRLILLYDLFFVLEKYRIDWDLFLADAERFGLTRFAFFALSLAQGYTPLTIPAEVRDALAPARLSIGERLFLHQQSRRRLRGSSILLYLAMNKGLAAKARFILRTAFPPPRILYQRHYQRGGSLLIAYLRRVGEIFAHLVGMVKGRR